MRGASPDAERSPIQSNYRANSILQLGKGAEAVRVVRPAGYPAEVARRAPDIIIGSWCGKKFRPERVAVRHGWEVVPAVVHGELHEIKSADILQPGPAAVTDGLRQLNDIITAWASRQ